VSDAFEQAFNNVVGLEAGYVNDPHDPGGETKYGISKRSYPNLDISAITLDQAQAIYHSDFWLKLRCDDLPEVVAETLFAEGVNLGTHEAALILQRSLGVVADGDIGPVTIAAATKLGPLEILPEFLGHVVFFKSTLPGWQRFGAGWSARAVKEAINSVTRFV
jgi:lysozyme family protein